jgi:hypothetical protein
MRKLNLILISAISGLIFSACSKSEIVTPDNSGKALNELVVSSSFTWNTALPVELKITGLPTIVPVSSTLTISLENGTPLFNEYHLMDQNLTVKLLLPSTEKKLVLKYGTVTYQVEVVNNQAAFSFIPVVTD